jgi:hypothetical protein
LLKNIFYLYIKWGNELKEEIRTEFLKSEFLERSIQRGIEILDVGLEKKK